MIIKIRNKLLSFVAFFYFYFVEFFNLKKFPIIISIEGGLGAQILSYALYVKLKRKGQKVYLDCEYFQRNNLKKTLGVSYWDWQLNDYGVSMDQIDHRNRSWVYRILMLRDSPTKLQKTISALQEATFSNLFKSSNKLKKQFSSLQLKRGYGAIHIRQGDFLNVASYVEDYFTLVIMFLKMIPDKSEIVILSDSILPSKIIDLVKKEGKKIHIFDNSSITPELSHYIMCKSNLCVVGNSQFGLTAGILSHQCIFPLKWSSQKSYNNIVRALPRYGYLSSGS